MKSDSFFLVLIVIACITLLDLQPGVGVMLLLLVFLNMRLDRIEERLK